MNATGDLLNCPIWTKRDYDIRDVYSFWVGGIAVCCVAVPGLFLNLTAICVLSTRVSTKNNFNQLLTSLFVFDSVFLFSALIEAFRRNFRLYTNIHIILFPKLLYPLRIISFTASTFMTVAIAHERYIVAALLASCLELERLWPVRESARSAAGPTGKPSHGA